MNEDLYNLTDYSLATDGDGLLLLEGYGLQKPNGDLLLCTSARLKYHDAHAMPERALRVPAPLMYEYEMFDEGELTCLDSKQVRDILDGGGRIIVMEI